jgi:rusticyanin
MNDFSSSNSEAGGPAPSAPPPPSTRTRHRTRARIAIVAVVLAAAGGSAGITAGFTSGSPPSAPAAATPSVPAPSGPGMVSPAMPSPGGSAMSSPSPSLAQSIGRQVGTAMAGMAPQTVSLAQTRTLGAQVPAGASVDKASNTITFTTSSVSFTVVAVPPGGPDMTFRVAGLTNPTLVVPNGAEVTVRFINGDNDEAHAWMIVNEQPPFSFYQPKTPAISGAFSGLIGDPTARGQGATTFTFQASPAGSYQYICPMPGHAQMGMHGAFIVR